MKQLTFSVFLCFYFVSYGQVDGNSSGISFEQHQSWPDIIAKAKKERKYIFVDVYATWCVPCRKMEKNIYSLPVIAKMINNNFFSVKVQTDTSKNDNEGIKSWYQEARRFNQSYRISEVPTYLFFSPNGEIVHRASGYKDSLKFAQLISEALDPKKQGYTQLKEYRQGIRNYPAMAALAPFSRDVLKDSALAQGIANDYMTKYLCKLPDEKLYNDDNMWFIAQFNQSSSDTGFKYIYKNQAKFKNGLKNKGYVEEYIDFVIFKENIRPLLVNRKITRETIDPNWDKIGKSISKVYNADYSSRAVLKGKIAWFRLKEDWERVVQYSIEKVEKHGAAGGFGESYNLNNIAWDFIFLHSDDKQALQKAIGWMEKIVRDEPTVSNFMDTYANLLYKTGKTAEAIKWEQKALQLAQENKEDEKIKYYEETIEKMQKGQVTWRK